MTAPTNNGRLPRGMRLGTTCVLLGYLLLGVSLAVRSPVALTALIPLGAICFVVGVALWFSAVMVEARAKDMI